MPTSRRLGLLPRADLQTRQGWSNQVRDEEASGQFDALVTRLLARELIPNLSSSLQVILKAIMLRRLKTAEINGKKILNLPERNVQVVTCNFDKDERAFYQALAEKTALTMSKVSWRRVELNRFPSVADRILPSFLQFMKSGTVMSNYVSIFDR